MGRSGGTRADLRIIRLLWPAGGWRKARTRRNAAADQPGSAAYGQPSDSAQQVNKSNWKQRSGGEKKLKLSFKEQREWDTIEDDIAALEDRIAGLDQEIEASASNYTRLNELMAEKEKTETKLEETMDRWVYLSGLVEQIEAQKQ